MCYKIFMKDLSCQTLFYPFVSGELEWPEVSAHTAFLNAHPDESLHNLHNPAMQQFFRPVADRLELAGYQCVPLVEGEAACDAVFVLAPKQKLEAQGMLAAAYVLLKEGGLLVCAGANHAGGNRLPGMIRQLGLCAQSLSKHKARVVWAYKSGNADIAGQWLDDASLQPVLEGAYQSCPGIFGWNKIDAGSALLAEFLPGDLTGGGADFGCGYGYLSLAVMEKNEGIEKLCCIDADYRALEACKVNLGTGGPEKEYLWADLSKPLMEAGPFDWIVMNPPFHLEKATDPQLGQGLIGTAAQSLRKGGVLWMVANTHLPYEGSLSTHFTSHEKVQESGGFKIYRAVA